MDPITTSALASGKVIQTINDIVNIGKRVNEASQTTSLVEFTKSARVEPLTIVSNDCINLEYLPDVMQSLLALFSGYYLQAISLSATVGDVKVTKILDRLNPDRSVSLMGFESYKESIQSDKHDWRMAIESYKHRLPTTKNKVAMEAEEKAISASADYNEGIKTIKDLTNLSVGKMLNVTVKNGEDKLQLPISVRLMVSSIPESSMTTLLSLGSEDTTISERYHAWRSGRISFIKDLMLGLDLIKAHKKALMEDKDGSYSEIIRRINNNKQQGLIEKNPSLAMASNLVVISDTTARNIEDKLGGKLSNIKVRNKIFDATYIMIMVVIDRQSERITFYHRGIAAGTNIGLRDIKAGNKNGGPDIMDIMKAYTLGNNPSM